MRFPKNIISAFPDGLRIILSASAVIGVIVFALCRWGDHFAIFGGTPISGRIAQTALTPTPFALTTGTVYCVTRSGGPVQDYFVPNKIDAEFQSFMNALVSGVTVTPAPAAGTNWVAGSCCACNTRCGTEANGTCGTRAATRTDTGCTSGCTTPTPNPCCSSCGSGQYMCQYDSGWACYTMCCTGNGCPSWACTNYCSTHGGVSTACNGSTCTCVDGAVYNCSADTCAYC